MEKEHVYHEIEGWFDYGDLYDFVIEESSPDAHFVEIGVYLGKSFSYLLTAVHNSGKEIKVDGIDEFSLFSTEFPPKNTREKFWENMNLYGLDNFINKFYELPEKKALDKYEDESLDFVFLDFTIDPFLFKPSVKQWYKKVKIGGYIAGHDGKYLMAAVQDIFENFDGGKVELMGHEGNPSWIYKKR